MENQIKNSPRHFAVCSKFNEEEIHLPERKTQSSAGYDLESAEFAIIPAGKSRVVSTGLKVYMPTTEYLSVRSGLSVKQQVMLLNGVGIIDADYVDNESNEGEIGIPLINMGSADVQIEKGQRIAQGIFLQYQKTDDEKAPIEMRSGGFHSTGAM